MIPRQPARDPDLKSCLCSTVVLLIFSEDSCVHLADAQSCHMAHPRGRNMWAACLIRDDFVP